MTRKLESIVVRIENAAGVTVGTGFAVSLDLIVTCAHVVEAAASRPGDKIVFSFYLYPKEKIEGQVLEDPLWRPSDREDIAFIRFQGVLPTPGHGYARLCNIFPPDNINVQSLGFVQYSDGATLQGTITGFESQTETGIKFLQLKSGE